MSFFGDLLKFAAIGALFIATGPFSLSITPFLATALRIGGTVLYYLSNQVDKALTSVERQLLSFRTNLQPGTPLPVVYGRAKVGGVIADWFLEKVGNEQVLYEIVALAHGSWDGDGIDAIESIWLDNNLAVTLNPRIAIDDSSVAGSTVVTTLTPHGLTTGDWVTIEGHTGSVPTINGNRVVTVTGSDTFTLPITVTTGGTGGVVAFDDREHPYATNVVDFQHFLGTDTQNVATTVLWGLRQSTTPQLIVLPPKSPTQVIDSEWATTGEGAGIVALSLRLWNLVVPEEPGSAEVHPAFPSGPPQVAAILSGVRVFDTRDDTWYPGGDNPAMCIRDYLVSTTYGCGYPDSLIDDTSFEDAADFCDELIEYDVDGDTVEQKRFTCNGVVDTGQSTSANLQELLSSCRGQLVWEQGKFKLRIRSSSVPSATLALNSSNILGQWSFRTPGLEDQFNLVTATFINPLAGEFKAEQVQWPEVGAANTYLSDDNDFLNRLDLSLPFTQDGLTAMGMASVVLLESRSGLTCSVLCTEEALQLSVGDRVFVTHETPGWSNKEFWVTAMDIRPDTTVALSLQEYDATAYVLPNMPFWEEGPPRTPKPSDETGYTPKRRVKGAFPTFFDDRLFASWESTGNSARVAVSTSDFPAPETGDIVGGEGANFDLGAVSPDVYYYVTITPYSGAAATGLPGEPHYFRALSPSATDPGAPTLTGVSISEAGGDLCNETDEWTLTVGWTTTGANDGFYRVDIEVAVNAPGTVWNPLVTGLTTFSSSYLDNTGLIGNVGGSTDPVTYYRKYRVSIVRKSDDATVDGPDATTQETLVVYTDDCVL